MHNNVTKMSALRPILAGLVMSLAAVGAPLAATPSAKSDDQAATTQGVITIYSNDQKATQTAINELLGDS